VFRSDFSLFFVDSLHSAFVQDVIICVRDEYMEIIFDIVTVLVYENPLDLELTFTSSDQLWCFFLCIIEIPKMNQIFTCH